MNTDMNLDVEITNDYHLGHLLLDCFKKRHKDLICQIDAAKDDKQTYGSALNLIVRLARSLRNMGYKPGDVILMGGTNHVKVRIPLYAGMMIGLPVCGVDPLFKSGEIKTLLKTTQAKLAFCDYASYDHYKKAAVELGSDLTIVTFETGDFTFEDLINKYDDNEPIKDFRPSVFDIDKVYAWLISTSGTTGPPKLAAIKHTVLLQPFKQYVKLGLFGNYLNEGHQRTVLCVSPVQWVSSYALSIGTILTGNALLISADYNNVDCLIYMINKYRPVTAAASPPLFSLILKSEKKCDFTCFDLMAFGGASVYKDFITELKARMHKDAQVLEAYGQTEMLGCPFMADKDTPIGSCGRIFPNCQAKLVDQNDEEITEPNVPGQLLFKGPTFSAYYRDPEETAKAFTEDGWLKTGDKLYRDEHGYFYFVERIKMLFKYRTIQIAPTEIEEVILTLPSVLEVCVTSIDHPIDQQWPVAVVVKRPGHNVTAQEIKDLVEEKLSDSKKLRGGVIFMDELPKTSTGKVARAQIRTMAASASRE